MPRWVAQRPAFIEEAEKVYESCGAMLHCEHVSELLALNTDVLLEASRRVKNLVAKKGASSAHEVLYFTTLLSMRIARAIWVLFVVVLLRFPAFSLA